MADVSVKLYDTTHNFKVMIRGGATLFTVLGAGNGDGTLEADAGIDANTSRIRRVVDPIFAQDAATKAYVDAGSSLVDDTAADFTVSANLAIGTPKLYRVGKISCFTLYDGTLAADLNDNGMRLIGNVVGTGDSAPLYHQYFPAHARSSSNQNVALYWNSGNSQLNLVNHSGATLTAGTIFSAQSCYINRS